jgi:hypothetical protein
MIYGVPLKHKQIKFYKLRSSPLIKDDLQAHNVRIKTSKKMAHIFNKKIWLCVSPRAENGPSLKGAALFLPRKIIIMRLAAAAFFHAALGNYNNGDFIHHTIGRIINITSRHTHTLYAAAEAKSPRRSNYPLLFAPAPDCCCCWIILMYERAHMHISAYRSAAATAVAHALFNDRERVLRDYFGISRVYNDTRSLGERFLPRRSKC